jgi:hypothetical protein
MYAWLCWKHLLLLLLLLLHFCYSCLSILLQYCVDDHERITSNLNTVLDVVCSA